MRPEPGPQLTLAERDRRYAGLRALMAVAHPDDAVRDNAKKCEPKIDRIDTGHSHISILDEIEVAIEPDIFPTRTRPTRVEAS